jgi:hypothetical protein
VLKLLPSKFIQNSRQSLNPSLLHPTTQRSKVKWMPNHLKRLITSGAITLQRSTGAYNLSSRRTSKKVMNSRCKVEVFTMTTARILISYCFYAHQQGFLLS